MVGNVKIVAIMNYVNIQMNVSAGGVLSFILKNMTTNVNALNVILVQM